MPSKYAAVKPGIPKTNLSATALLTGDRKAVQKAAPKPQPISASPGLKSYKGALDSAVPAIYRHPGVRSQPAYPGEEAIGIVPTPSGKLMQIYKTTKPQRVSAADVAFSQMTTDKNAQLGQDIQHAANDRRASSAIDAVTGAVSIADAAKSHDFAKTAALSAMALPFGPGKLAEVARLLGRGAGKKVGEDVLATSLKDLPEKGAPSAHAQQLANEHTNKSGIAYNPPKQYIKVDEARAKKIADEYTKALDINHPDATPAYKQKVNASYQALGKETLDQYHGLVKAGYKFEFYPEGKAPYASPWEAMKDLKENKHLYVFPTDSGFGNTAETSSHPLLADSGIKWGSKTATLNDIFRAVHDFYGHFKEGVGFRAHGEENAWRSHSAMYSPEARGAMTTETRGQNAWVNYGPHGEKNQTAGEGDTVYADQKAALLPDWVQTEGANDPSQHGLGTPEEVSAKLRKARDLRAQQEEGYAAERSRRAGLAEEAMKVGGEEGFNAGLEQLGGVLPKLHFGAFADFDQAGLDSLLTHVQQHPSLRPFEKIRTQRALLGVLRGEVPTRGDNKLLQSVFGAKTVKNINDSIPFWKRAKHVGIELINVPRSLMASFDLSAPFRQGLMVGTSHPRIFFKNFESMFKAAGSEKAYHAIHDEILARPTYDLMEKSGLAMTELGRLEEREEQFMSNFAEKIPVAGRIVRGSGRAYTGFLNKTRADVFDHLVKAAHEEGLDIEDEKLLKSIARFVNSATGRGDLGALQEHATTLNALMFSPRLLASRLNFMNPVYYAKLDPFARKAALKAALGLVGTISTVLVLAKLGGAKVNTDPRNADFAKVHIKDTRLDILGGFQQPLRLLSQLADGKVVSSTTGKTLNLGPQGPGKLSRKDIAQRFFESKLAPVPSFINDLFKGTDYSGKPFSWKTAAWTRMTPLLAQDAADLYSEYGSLAAVAGYGLGAFGVGVQTYKPTPPKSGSSPAGSPYGSLITNGVGSSYGSLTVGP